MKGNVTDRTDEAGRFSCFDSQMDQVECIGGKAEKKRDILSKLDNLDLDALEVEVSVPPYLQLFPLDIIGLEHVFPLVLYL